MPKGRSAWLELRAHSDARKESRTPTVQWTTRFPAGAVTVPAILASAATGNRTQILELAIQGRNHWTIAAFRRWKVHCTAEEEI